MYRYNLSDIIYIYIYIAVRIAFAGFKRLENYTRLFTNVEQLFTSHFDESFAFAKSIVSHARIVPEIGFLHFPQSHGVTVATDVGNPPFGHVQLQRVSVPKNLENERNVVDVYKSVALIER